MNMDIWLDSVRTEVDGPRKVIVLEMNVRKPRVWHVVAWLSGEDVRHLLRLVLFSPSVLLTGLRLIFQPDDTFSDLQE
jgi:hypothetical protein